MNFDLVCELREGGHHSGNWGGLLANPGVDHGARAGLDRRRDSGAIKMHGMEADRHAQLGARGAGRLSTVEGGEDAPEIDPDWGEPGLTPSEKVFGWCSFEVLAFTTGNPENPVNAIPPKATATCQIRFVVGVDPEEFMPALRRHLDAHGFPMVADRAMEEGVFPGDSGSTPTIDWVRWAAASIQETTGKRRRSCPISAARCPTTSSPTILACRRSGSRIPTPSCSQHAPNEHMLAPVAREALAVMTGIYLGFRRSGRAKAAAPR